MQKNISVLCKNNNVLCKNTIMFCQKNNHFCGKTIIFCAKNNHFGAKTTIKRFDDFCSAALSPRKQKMCFDQYKVLSVWYRVARILGNVVGNARSLQKLSIDLPFNQPVELTGCCGVFEIFL